MPNESTQERSNCSISCAVCRNGHIISMEVVDSDPALYFGRPLWSGREIRAVLRHVREHSRHRGNERKESNPAAARTAEHSSSQLAETGCRNFAQCSWLRTLFQPNRGGLWHVDELGPRRSAMAKSMSTRLLSNSGGWSIRRV